MDKSISTTRVNFDLPDGENDLLNKHLPKGIKGEIMRGLCRMLIRDMEGGRFATVIQALVDDSATIKRREP